jgi:Phosphotransferase enzyme family
MSTSSPAWQSHYHIILLHPMEPRILMLPGQGGWSLPHFRREERDHMNHAEPIIKAMQEQFGIHTTVLYCAYHYIDRENKHQANAIYVLENRNPAWVPPPGGKWVGREALADLAITIPGQRKVIDTCLRESEEHAIPALRSPWARRGWFDLVELWIREQLARLNCTIIAPIEQVKTWGISCVLRIPTTNGNIYFKVIPTSFMQEQVPASSPVNSKPPLLFAHEPMLTQALAVLYPRNMPTALAVDRERCWMLLADLGSELYENPDKTAWRNALRVYGQLQVGAANQIETLFAAGCLDRRLDVLERQIDPLLSDKDTLSGLGKGRIEQLRASAPKLKAMCRELASYAVPQTLVHGDLHAGNIALRNDNPIYFDWTDGCVAHPFFDVITFLENVDNPAEQIHLRDVYLSQWTDYEPMERLLEAFKLGAILGAVHQAVSYQHIIAHMEGMSKVELRGGASYWLRVLLQLLAETV